MRISTSDDILHHISQGDLTCYLNSFRTSESCVHNGTCMFSLYLVYFGTHHVLIQAEKC